MHKPNYKDGSLVNLMSSITSSFGHKPLYKPLKALPPKELSAKNIVLFVIDGLGFEYLKKYGNGSIFEKNLKAKITSVFPSTTAACVTTFATGVAPQQHAITGWYVHLKELGIVSAILPFIPRAGGLNFQRLGVKHSEIFDQKKIYEQIDDYFIEVMPKHIVGKGFRKGTRVALGYNNLNNYFAQTKKAIAINNRRKFIYSYWGLFDSICHENGPNSKKAFMHFKAIERKMKSFLKSIERTNTTVIITADHGFMETIRKNIVFLSKHPKLQECMTLPLCGEPRAAYCYVRPSKDKQFRGYVKKHLSKYCWLFKSEDLIKRGFFGMYKPNPKLKDRIGDYVLIMKEGHIIKDSLMGRKESYHIGNHGGVSKEEMFVPLIVVKA